MSKNSAKISSNYGESISTHEKLHPISPETDSGKKLNQIQVIKERKEDILNSNKEPEEKSINYIINF